MNDSRTPGIEDDRANIGFSAHSGRIAQLRCYFLATLTISFLQASSLAVRGDGMETSKIIACSVAPQVRKSLAVKSSPTASRKYFFWPQILKALTRASAPHCGIGVGHVNQAS